MFTSEMITSLSQPDDDHRIAFNTLSSAGDDLPELDRSAVKDGN